MGVEIINNNMFISTHAPRTGSDFTVMMDEGLIPEISTHAPRTGSDSAK